jgi:hypothetical protein
MSIGAPRFTFSRRFGLGHFRGDAAPSRARAMVRLVRTASANTVTVVTINGLPAARPRHDGHGPRQLLGADIDDDAHDAPANHSIDVADVTRWFNMLGSPA